MSKNNLVWMSVDEAYGRPVSGGYAPDPLCIACRQGISGMYSQDQPGEVVPASQRQEQAEETNAGGSRPIIWDHAPSEPIEKIQPVTIGYKMPAEWQQVNTREHERVGR